MGAAVAKALDGIADAPATLAEARLAVAAHAVLQWDSSPAADAVGVWDADAACANRSLLSAVDEILDLKETHAFPMASPARRRMDGALGVAMSRLMDEFLLLRVWDASQLEGRHGLRVAAERLSVSVGPGGSGVCLAFPTGGSTSTGGLSVTTTGELRASGTSLSSWPDTVFVDGEFSEEDLRLTLICTASLPVLHEIALRVIRAGYTKELLQTFTKASCHVLDRFLSILQLDRPFLAANRVNFEDAEWWTAEDMVKRWILATKLVGKALVVMQRQLREQKLGAFDRFKDDYFMAIAKQAILVLLKFADGFTSTRSPEKLIYVLELYETLSDSAPSLLPLFTGHHAELISRQVSLVLAHDPNRLLPTSGERGARRRRPCAGAARHDLRRAAGATPEHHGFDPRERRRRRGRDVVWEPRVGAGRRPGTQPGGEIRGRLAVEPPVAGQQRRLRAEPRRGRRRRVSARGRVGCAASETSRGARGELRPGLLGPGRRVPGDGSRGRRQAGESARKIQRRV